MEWTTLFDIALGAILINNFILVQFLGICPFMGVSKKMDTAVGMGFAVIFVMALASALCYPVNVLLESLDLKYMQTVAFILVIAALVQFVEMFLKKSMPSLYEALGVYLPLITTNCAVLGAVLLNVQNHYNFIESVVYGITGGAGFLLAIVLFASIRERLEFADPPKAFKGFPIALVTAGLLSPRVAAELEGPFFVAAGLLGDSARLEGLISALWLLPDLVLAGLFSRSWGEGPRPAGAVLAGLALALAGVPGWIPVEGLALGCLVLAAATLVLPPGGDK